MNQWIKIKQWIKMQLFSTKTILVQVMEIMSSKIKHCWAIFTTFPLIISHLKVCICFLFLDVISWIVELFYIELEYNCFNLICQLLSFFFSFSTILESKCFFVFFNKILLQFEKINFLPFRLRTSFYKIK